MRIPHYLIRSRHHIFSFRFPIPSHLHPQGQRSDVKVSLKTRCPREALMLSACLLYIGKALLQQIDSRAMDYIDIKRTLSEHFSRALANRIATINAQGRLSAKERQAYEDGIEWVNDALVYQNFDYVGNDEAPLQLAEKCNVGLKPGDDKWPLFRDEYYQARNTLFSDILKYDAGLDGYTLQPAMPLQSQQSKSTARYLRDIIAEYLKERQANREITPKTYDEIVSHLNIFQEYMGNEASAEVSVDDARAFNTLLRKLPKFARSRPELMNISLQQLAELPENHPSRSTGPRSPGSIQKYLNNYKYFFNWAVDMGLIAHNPFSKIRTKAKGKSAKRIAYSKEEADLIVNAAMKLEKHHYKWGILLARYTGARPEEIAQMHVNDIILRDDVWCLHFNDDGDTKRLKTKASNRITPIHSKLIELGFMDYLEETRKAGKERVLYQLPLQGRNGFKRNLSRFVNERLLIDLGIKDRLKDFYTLRHTAVTEMVQANVLPGIIGDIVGHERVGTTMRNYAGNHTIAQLKAAVEMIGSF